MPRLRTQRVLGIVVGLGSVGAFGPDEIRSIALAVGNQR